MNREIFSVFKDALFLLFKHPLYFIFGILAFFPGNIPFLVRTEDAGAILEHYFSTSSPQNTSLLFSCLFIGTWFINLSAFSWLCLNVLSQKKKRPLEHTLKTSLFTTPRIALIRIAGFLFFAILLYFLILPVQTLVETGSAFSAWILGILAFAIFFGAGVSFFSTFLFAHFYALFAQLSFQASFPIAANLFLKNKKISSLFVVWIALVFIPLTALTSFLPGFLLAPNSITPVFPELPLFVNITGFIFSSLLLTFLSSFFPVFSTLFFLHISRNKKLKKSVLPQTESVLETLRKKNSEAIGEIK